MVKDIESSVKKKTIIRTIRWTQNQVHVSTRNNNNYKCMFSFVDFTRT